MPWSTSYIHTIKSCLPSLSIYCSIKRKTPTGYEKNWHSPLKKHGFSCFINNSKSMHKSVPGTIYLYFPSSVFQNNRIYPICTSIVLKFSMQFASSRSRTCLFRSFPKWSIFLELYSCTIMSVTIYNPAQDTGTKPQSYINKCSTSIIFLLHLSVI